MIDNNIIQTLGVGSGIDTSSLVTQLVEVEKSATQTRIDTKTELAETRISDFGLLTSALSTLKDAAEALTDPEALFSKSASFTDSDALVPLELDTDVAPGSYSFNVSQVARSQTLAFSGFSDPTEAVGEGTLTFNFGSYARTDDTAEDIDLSYLPVEDIFVENTEKASVDIVIDSDNNSLEGLRDAINDGDFGVKASLIYDGSSYNLSIVAESGSSNEIEIVVDEGDGGTNTDASDLSRFAFNQDKAGFEAAESQGGNNAILTLNGIAIERSSNTIDDIVEGLTLDVLKTMEATEVVTITIADDKSFAEENIRGFVESYNAFLEVIDPIFGSTDVEDEDGETESIIGSLANDALAKSLLSQIRGVIASSIPGLSDSNYTSLTNIGIRTELDGTLSIDEDDFETALEDNFSDLQKLLAPHTSSSSSDVYINSFNDGTSAGEYEIDVTSAPSKGAYTADASATLTTDENYTFTIKVDGVSSDSLVLDTETYDSNEELAAALQSLINSDSNLSEAGESVTVNHDGNGFVIESSSYGASSNVSITAASAESINDLGLTVQAGTVGTAALGTIDGVDGFGSANVLLPNLDEPGAGLAMIIGENAFGVSTVNFSRGFAGELESLINSFLESDGVIATRTETLDTNIESYEAEQERLDRRMSAFEERLMNQFIAMEQIISSLESTGSYLDSLIDTLPFTASN